MKKIYLLFLLVPLFISCSDTDDVIDQHPEPEQPEPEQPVPSKKVKLPKSIQYKFTNYLDYEFYTSENLYEYDSLNRITHININTSLNNVKAVDYEYSLVYRDTTNMAKGFEIRSFDHRNSQESYQYVKLNYTTVKDTNSYKQDFAYFQYVYSKAELNDDNFTFIDSQKISGSFAGKNFYPYDCGRALFPYVARSYVHVGEKGYSHIEYVDSKSFVLRGRIIPLIPSSEDKGKTPFCDANFDFVFWTFFLHEQYFQYETGSIVPSSVTVYDKSYDEKVLRTITFSNLSESNIYSDKYPLYKMYSGKYWEQTNDVKSTYEYNVTYY